MIGHYARIAAIAAASVAAAGAMNEASANIITYYFRAGNYATSSTVATPIPLDNAGRTTIYFPTTRSDQLVRITYNAECGALGSPGSWLSVTIKVDGVQAQPASGNLFALCTATSTSSYSWVGAVRQSLIRVPNPGYHSLQVIGQEEGLTQWWQGDSSIVIDN